MRKPFCLQAIAAGQASQLQFPVQWRISRREGGRKGLDARRSAGERERGRQGQREAESLKSAWQGFIHVADEFEYICLSGLQWSACAAIFEKLRCWHL